MKLKSQAVEDAVREAISKPDGEILPADLQGLTTLHLSDVETLEGIEGAPNLKELHIDSSEVTDLTPLVGLSALTELVVESTPIADLGPLARLPNLRRVKLYYTEVTDLSPLAGLQGLTELVVGHRPMSSKTPPGLAPLANLHHLRSLSLSSVPVSDLSPLAGLRTLEELDLKLTAVEDVAPLAGLDRLRELDLSGTQVSDLAPLAGLSALENLTMSYLPVDDLSPLAGLRNLRRLRASATEGLGSVSDLAPLSGLRKLELLGLEGMPVSDLRPLAGLQNLGRLSLGSTEVTDLAPLVELGSLKGLTIDATVANEQAAIVEALRSKGVDVTVNEDEDDEDDEDDAPEPYTGEAEGYAPSEKRDKARVVRMATEDSDFIKFGDKEEEFAQLLSVSRRDNLAARLEYCAGNDLLDPSCGFAEQISEYEEHIVWRPRGKVAAPFAYSIGLYYLHNLPEILLVDETGRLDAVGLSGLINLLSEAVLAEELRLEPNTALIDALQVERVAEGYDWIEDCCTTEDGTPSAHFETVDPDTAEEFLGYCSWFYMNFMDTLPGDYPALICRLRQG